MVDVDLTTSIETFDSLAQFLIDYFHRYDHTYAADAICFDGGPSSQLAYSLGGAVVNRQPANVATPDSLTLVAR